MKTELTKDEWADFVARLRHDHIGDGVKHHSTANPLFVVQQRIIIDGIDLAYTEKKAVSCVDSDALYFSPGEFYESLDEEEREPLEEVARRCGNRPFLEAFDEQEQWFVLKEQGFQVTGVEESWEYVNCHLTHEAALAFIERKKHDYPLGLRVYVDSQRHCNEFNAVVGAILSGKLVFAEGVEK